MIAVFDEPINTGKSKICIVSFFMLIYNRCYNFIEYCHHTMDTTTTVCRFQRTVVFAELSWLILQARCMSCAIIGAEPVRNFEDMGAVDAKSNESSKLAKR